MGRSIEAEKRKLAKWEKQDKGKKSRSAPVPGDKVTSHWRTRKGSKSTKIMVGKIVATTFDIKFADGILQEKLPREWVVKSSCRSRTEKLADSIRARETNNFEKNRLPYLS